MTKPTKDIEYVAFEKKCIDFNKEFYCPHCNKRIFLVCVNLRHVCRWKFLLCWTQLP